MKTISIEEAIHKDGSLLFAPTGRSMLPFIKAGRDVVLIIDKDNTQRCRKMDAVLFKRTDGSFVLHRIIRIKSDEYWLTGDNCTWGETIKENQIIGIVTEIRRHGRVINVHALQHLIIVYGWYSIWFLRYSLAGLKTVVTRIMK